MSIAAEENLEEVRWHVKSRVPKYIVIYFHVTFHLQTWSNRTKCNSTFQLNNSNLNAESKDSGVYELNMILAKDSSLVLYNAV
jgi:hypothetical protein